MKSLYKIFLFSFAFQFIYAQQGVLDTGFGVNGTQRVSKLMYYNGDGNPRGTVKVLFNTSGSSVYLGNDLVNGGILPIINTTSGALNPNNVWNKRTVVKDGVFDTNNRLYSTGFTEKEDNNKAIFVATIVNNQDIAAGNALNHDGKIVFDTKEADEEGIAIKIQSDNKIVVLGYSGTKGILIRYNADGYLDRSFNQKGFYSFQIAQNTKPTSLAIQSDGKILVAGNCINNNNTDFFITRLNTNGTIDSAFGTNGVVIKDVNNHDNTGNGMVLANNGNILICGKAYTVGGDFGVENQYSYNFSVFKFDQNGSLVTSASNGILPGAFIKSLSMYQYTNPPTIVPDDEELKCMAYDSVNDRIYLYGYANKKSYDNQYNIITRKTGLWCYCISLDNSFTLQGSTTFQSPTNYTDFETEIVSASIKPSDMVLGSALTKVYAVVKFDNCSSGQSTFVSIPSSSSNTFPSACNNNAMNLVLSKIQKTNNGYYGLVQTNNDVYDMYKLDTNYIIDSNFGMNGKISNVKDFKIDNDGKLICTMNTTIPNYGTATLLARFTATGQIDTTFGTLGQVRVKNLVNVFGLNVTSDNSYIISSYRGVYTSNPNPSIILQKVDNNGEINTSFGTLTTLSTNMNSGYPSLKNSEDIVNDNLGNHYTISYEEDVFDIQNQIINLVKLNETGVFDSNFGTNGTVNLIPFFSEPTNKLNLVRLNNGKLLAYSDKRLIQINSNGTLDTSFGTNGFIDGTTIIPDFIISRVITNGTDYFIGGYKINGGDNSTVIKMNNLGVIDTSFANNGIFIDSDANTLNYSHGLKNMFFENLNKIVIYGNGTQIRRIQ